MKLVPCMGGFCNSREMCAHYYQHESTLTPQDRLCGGKEEPERVRVLDDQPRAIQQQEAA